MRGLLPLVVACLIATLSLICAGGTHNPSQGAAGLDGLAELLIYGLGGISAVISLLVCAVRALDAPEQAQGTAVVLMLGTALGAVFGLPPLLAAAAKQGDLHHHAELCPDPAPETLTGDVSIATGPPEGWAGPAGTSERVTRWHHLRREVQPQEAPQPDRIPWTLWRIDETEPWTIESTALADLGPQQVANDRVTLVSFGPEVAWVLAEAPVRLSWPDRKITVLAGGSLGQGLTSQRFTSLDANHVTFFSGRGPVLLSRDRLDRVEVPFGPTDHRDYDDDLRVSDSFVCFVYVPGGTPIATDAIVLTRDAGWEPDLWTRARAALGATGLGAAGLGVLGLVGVGLRQAMSWRRYPTGSATERVLLSLAGLLCLGWVVLILTSA